MTFHVGQKVVCVDDSGAGINPYWRGDVPIKNEIYTVRDILIDPSKGPAYKLNELHCLDNEWYLHKHFRPLQEQGMSMLRAILANPKRELETTE